MSNRQVALICAVFVAYGRNSIKNLSDIQTYARWFLTWLDEGKW